jgi:hypothetical protein
LHFLDRRVDRQCPLEIRERLDFSFERLMNLTPRGQGSGEVRIDAEACSTSRIALAFLSLSSASARMVRI